MWCDFVSGDFIGDVVTLSLRHLEQVVCDLKKEA